MTVYVYNKETDQMYVKFKDRNNKVWLFPDSFDNLEEHNRKKHEEVLKFIDWSRHYKCDPTILKEYDLNPKVNNDKAPERL